MNPPDVPKSTTARRVSRRWLLRLGLCGIPLAAVVNALWVEPNWFKVRKLKLARGMPGHRFIHFTDLHHKGDRDFLQSVVKAINAQSPEFVGFSGDIVEDAEFLSEALELLQQIKSPLYGVPGNHDYWSHADFNLIGEAFAKTGGRWLLDESATAAAGQVNIAGATCRREPQLALDGARKNVVLFHYPDWVDKLGNYQFDLALAGHSHGGQVRLPFVGPVTVPYGVGRYDLGLFQTTSGPLYVGAGLGWFDLNIRFNCRPEITVIEI